MFSISSFTKVLFLGLISVSLTAVADNDVLKNLNYPELQVTPLASKRIQDEAKVERSNKWSAHWPIQVSALATLMASGAINGNYDEAATTTEKSENSDAAKVGGIVGLAWLGATVAFTMYHTPYKNAYRTVKKMPQGSKREKLAKERAAESAIDSAASFGSRLTWLSFATNLAASVNMASNTDDKGGVAAGVSVLLSAAPLLFGYRWNKVADEHKMYKKKIYGPIAQTVLLPVDQGKSLIPGVSLTMTF